MLPRQVCQLPCFCAHILWRRLVCENEQIICLPWQLLYLCSESPPQGNAPAIVPHLTYISALPPSLSAYSYTLILYDSGHCCAGLQTGNLNVHNRDLCLAYTTSNGYWMPQGIFSPGEWHCDLGSTSLWGHHLHTCLLGSPRTRQKKGKVAYTQVGKEALENNIKFFFSGKSCFRHKDVKIQVILKLTLCYLLCGISPTTDQWNRMMFSAFCEDN